MRQNFDAHKQARVSTQPRPILMKKGALEEETSLEIELLCPAFIPDRGSASPVCEGSELLQPSGIHLSRRLVHEGAIDPVS